MSAEPDGPAPHPPIAVDPVLGRFLATVATGLRGYLELADAHADVLARRLVDYHLTLPEDCDCPALIGDLEELRTVLRIIRVPLACVLAGLPPAAPIEEAQA